MNRYKIMLAVIAAFALGNSAMGQTYLGAGHNTGRTVSHQTTNLTLTPGVSYVLTGLWFIDAGVTLTIQPGTVITGELAATLIIQPGATINAQGTAANPIIFTSTKPAGQRQPGDWGGVIILGKAPVNQSAPVIEGGIIPGTYGGTDPNDNSGIFQYVRIEFAGYRFQLNNEVNGLTMGGVGRGTKIDHVQVSYAFDDSFEWFGGTVDCDHLVAFGGTDDEFDTDFGFSGRVQFAFGMRDPNVWDPTGESNGFESDNMGSPQQNLPLTAAQWSNTTLVGPRRTDATVGVAGNRFQYGMLLRRATNFSVYNSIIMGYPGGLALRDAFTVTDAFAGGLKIRNTSIAADSLWPTGAVLTTYGIVNTNTSASSTPPNNFTNAQVQDWFKTPTFSNIGGSGPRVPSTIGLADLSNLNAPDPRPTAASEAATAGTEFTNLNAQNGNYFTPVTYRGAFDPALPMASQWTAGWTNFDPQGAAGVTQSVITTTQAAGQWVLRSVPNTTSDYLYSNVFPASVGIPWSYKSGAYTAANTLENGDGYWVYYGAANTNSIFGIPLSTTSVTVTVPAGGRWALVGSVTTSKPIANLTVTGPATRVGSVYGWDGSAYVAATTIDPGKAYWVFLQATGAGGSVTLTVTP